MFFSMFLVTRTYSTVHFSVKLLMNAISYLFVEPGGLPTGLVNFPIPRNLFHGSARSFERVFGSCSFIACF